MYQVLLFKPRRHLCKGCIKSVSKTTKELVPLSRTILMIRYWITLQHYKQIRLIHDFELAM